MSAPKYIKVWQGVTASTGVGMGDHGGYPCTEIALIETLDELVNTFNPRADYYALTPVNRDEVARAVAIVTRLEGSQ